MSETQLSLLTPDDPLAHLTSDEKRKILGHACAGGCGAAPDVRCKCKPPIVVGCEVQVKRGKWNRRRGYVEGRFTEGGIEGAWRVNIGNGMSIVVHAHDLETR